ncbi:hypothetical protein [Hahella ganghwensis]|uniref:hypothetical protein n=1 Tax=Hahella ganghwensis TaxID=286420 RepID=UPI00035FB380|nr:hypothetical protein [Hahella ganghwensis]
MDTWIEMTSTMEKDINETIDACYPYDWEENHITRSILAAIRSTFSSRRYLRGVENVAVSFESYKLDGKYETYFGDIVFLIQIARKGEKPIVGAAFLEAKRRDLKSIRYSEIKVPQARRILRVAPRAFYILYDYEFTTRFVTQEGYSPWTSPRSPMIARGVEYAPVARVLATPINAALASGSKDIRLYNQALPFTAQFMSRYLCGLDLEYEPEALAVAAGWREKKGLPKRIVRVDVYEGHEPPEPVKVNDILYRQEG